VKSYGSLDSGLKWVLVTRRSGTETLQLLRSQNRHRKYVEDVGGLSGYVTIPSSSAPRPMCREIVCRIGGSMAGVENLVSHPAFPILHTPPSL